MSTLSSGPSRKEHCPICAKLAQTPHQPFCSSRCQMLDLGNWFSETYRAPASEPETLPEQKDENL